MDKIQEVVDGLKTDFFVLKAINDRFQSDFTKLLTNVESQISFKETNEEPIPQEFMAFLSEISNYDFEYDYKKFDAPTKFEKEEPLFVSCGSEEIVKFNKVTVDYDKTIGSPERYVVNYDDDFDNFYVFKVLKNDYKYDDWWREFMDENGGYANIEDAELLPEDFSFWKFVTDECGKTWEHISTLEKGLAMAHKSAWDAAPKNIKPNKEWAHALELIDKDEILTDKSEMFAQALMQMRLDLEVIDYKRVNDILTALVNLNKVNDAAELLLLKKVYLIIERSINRRLMMEVIAYSNPQLEWPNNMTAEDFYLLKNKVGNHYRKMLTIIEKISLFRARIVWLQTVLPDVEVVLQGGDKADSATEQAVLTQSVFKTKHFTRRD